MRRLLIICLLIPFVSIYSQTLTITGYQGPITEGSTLQLQATLSPATPIYDTYTWSSSNTAVATVNGNGLVTAVSEGTATIKCVVSAEGPSSQYFTPPSEKTATCVITIVKETVELITFADANVKAICVANWDTDEDGQLSIDEAAAVTDIGIIFKGNESITSFEELAYFTGVTSIQENAFYGCSNLTAITIPCSVTFIGNAAFHGSSLTSITVESGNTKYDSRDNCNAIIETNSNKLINGCKNTVIPNSVTSISSSAFYYCKGLASVTIPNGVTSIGASAFSQCTDLTSVTIPKSVTSIGENAFAGCGSLSIVTADRSTPLSIQENVFLSRANATLYVPFGCKPAYEAAIYWKDFKEIKEMEARPSDDIIFADAEAKRICVENWDTNNDGELSFAEAAAVTKLNLEFYNSNIVSFDEFKYFTGITILRHQNETGNGYVFSNCSKLEKLTLPETIEEIGDHAFNSDVSLKSISLPTGLKKIGSFAFRECSSLTNIIIPETVESIGSFAFAYCYGISSIYIPKNVSSIGSCITSTGGKAFASIIVDSENPYYDSRDNCNAIIETATNKLICDGSNTIIPNTVISLGDWVFNSRKDTEIVIPDQITSIGTGAFSACTNLESITLPSSITSISSEAIRYCFNLKEVRACMPSPITITDRVFFEVELYNVTLYVPKGSKKLYQAANVWKTFKEIIEMEPTDIIDFADAEVKRICVENWDINGDKELSYTEAAAVTDIGELFKGNTTVTSFDELQYFTGLTSIGDRAFDNCKHLTSIRLPEGLSSIGTGAFLYCDLQSIYIPASVMEIGYYAFVSNNNLTSIQVDATNTHYDSRSDCNAIIETSTNTLIQGCKTTIIPTGIKKIGNFAFEFVNLTHIDLPQGLEEISWNAFYGCTNLNEIVFPDGLNIIERYAFNGCTKLETIIIPSSMEYMSGSSFAGCYNIETFTVAPGGETYYTPDGSNAVVSKDGTTLVAGCKNTVIPETVVTIGSECFYDQLNLMTISIPSNVTTIEAYAFCGCSALTEIDIPKSVESIGEYAFSGCRIESVIIRKNIPIAITANVFTNSSNAILYVPKGCKTAYKAALYWKDFLDIVELDDEEPSGPVEVTDITQMDNAVYITPFTARIGSDVTIEVCLKNAQPATAYVFDLVLPEGITVAKDNKGKYIDALSDRHVNHSRSINLKDDNTYSLLTYSLSSEGLTGNNGAIRLLTLHVDNNINQGVYAIRIKNAQYSMSDGNTIFMANTTSSITLEDTFLGDANGNDEIDIADAVTIVNYLVGKEYSLFVKKAADTNKNGQVDIGDAVTIVNYLVGTMNRLSRQIRIRWDEREAE